MPARSAATAWRFRCAECGFGDAELGPLADGSAEYCLVCYEEQGRRVTLAWWEEPARPLMRACEVA